MWRTYTYDTMTGKVLYPIDIPSFSWQMNIGDSSLATTKDKGTGVNDLSSVTVPWSEVPGNTASERNSRLSATRRGIVLFWHDDNDSYGEFGTPILMGAIGQRSDTESDTSFSLDSTLTILDSRILCWEGHYGAGAGNTTHGDFTFKSQSLRGIAADIGYYCTNYKPGGALPVDWQYQNEHGSHDRTYYGYNSQNNSAKKLLTDISNVINGPDMTFRPYLSPDGSHVRELFLAGSDNDIYLPQKETVSLQWFAGASQLDSISVDHLGAITRQYCSGNGTEQSQIEYLAQDLTLQHLPDPYPLMEASKSFSDDEKASVLIGHGRALIGQTARPMMQIKAEGRAEDIVGKIWAGETVSLSIKDFPTLPDGIYVERLMEMSGDESDTVKLTFDVDTDPSILGAQQWQFTIN